MGIFHGSDIGGNPALQYEAGAAARCPLPARRYMARKLDPIRAPDASTRPHRGGSESPGRTASSHTHAPPLTKIDGYESHAETEARAAKATHLPPAAGRSYTAHAVRMRASARNRSRLYGLTSAAYRVG